MWYLPVDLGDRLCNPRLCNDLVQIVEQLPSGSMIDPTN